MKASSPVAGVIRHSGASIMVATKTYACQDCNETFTAIHRLVTHRAVEHPPAPKTDDEIFGRFERGRAS